MSFVVWVIQFLIFQDFKVRMALIEGFGDEVILTLVVFAILTLLVLAWMSTGVRDRPLISVIVVDGQNFHRILQRISNLTFRPIHITRLGSNASDSATTQPERIENVDLAESIQSETEVTDSDSNQTTDHSAESQSGIVVTANEIDEGSSVDGSSDVPERSQVKTSEEKELGTASSEPNTETSSADMGLVNAEESDNQDDGDLRIRLKYLDDRQRLVRAKPEDTVGAFKRKHFGRELAENLMVRFIYNGQELRQDGNTLQAYNVSDNSVIHCLFSSRPTQESPQRQSTLIPEDWDAGYLMFPLFGVILGITWYFRIVYRTYFNAMSTFSLIGITFLFFIALLASIRTHEEDELLD